MLDDLFNGRVDGKKPRQEGLTLSVDKLESFDRENFEILAAVIDQIKIYNTHPLLTPMIFFRKGYHTIIILTLKFQLVVRLQNMLYQKILLKSTLKSVLRWDLTSSRLVKMA